MSAALFWRTVTPSNSPRHLMNGVELSVALFGPHQRYAAYEVRCRDAEGHSDREYVVRDAEAISDADLQAGIRAPVIGRTRNYASFLQFVAKMEHGMREIAA